MSMDGANRLSLRNNRLKLKISWKLPPILEESMELYPNFTKKNRIYVNM